MPVDKSIFSLRFGSNPELQPTREELASFVRSPKKAGSRDSLARDLEHYDEMFGKIEEFVRKRELHPDRQDIRERMLYGVLELTSFFSPALRSAVAQYRYHLHALMALDFRKPRVFIRTAEEEIDRLNPKRQDDAAKRSKLRAMVAERKRTLETLGKRREERVEELSNIARYVRDNLARIVKVCEGSIVLLVDFQIAGREKSRLVEDIKDDFRRRLRYSLHYGRLTRDELESAKQEVSMLSEELSAFLRDDVFSMTTLLEAVHDHARKDAGEIDALMRKIGAGENADPDRDDALYEQIGDQLVSLVAAFHFDLKARPIQTETGHEDMLLENRKALLDNLFALLHTERRSSHGRRSGEDRRKFNDPDYLGPTRRSGKPRRAGKSRR
jgi:hypothetical protein